ncbi:uncharacterized protein BT62DRAFT_938771, partial [Guyanagaster necrorhizus]
MTGPSYPQLPWWIVPPELPPLLHNPCPVVPRRHHYNPELAHWHQRRVVGYIHAPCAYV